MSRLAFDSDNIADLPRDALALTYSDLVPDLAALARLEAEFTHGLVLIDRNGTDPTGAASVIDVETGLHKPEDAPLWWDRKSRAGVRYLTVYASRVTMPAVDAAMGRRSYFRWFATLDGSMHIPGFPPGRAPALVQFASEAMLGFHADASVIWEDQWHPVPVPGRHLVSVTATGRYSDGSVRTVTL